MVFQVFSCVRWWKDPTPMTYCSRKGKLPQHYRGGLHTKSRKVMILYESSITHSVNYGKTSCKLVIGFSNALILIWKFIKFQQKVLWLLTTGDPIVSQVHSSLGIIFGQFVQSHETYCNCIICLLFEGYIILIVNFSLHNAYKMLQQCCYW